MTHLARIDGAIPGRLTGWKLFSLKKDGSIGPLFINRRLRLDEGTWYDAEEHRTKGFAFRAGWHVCAEPVAPHLTEKGRIWRRVEIENYVKIVRPVQQGGVWYLAERMRVI